MLWTFVKNRKISLHKGYMRLEYMMYTGGMRNQQILRYDIMICEEYIGGINMKKTWLALLLAMVMLASVFTGCTSKPAEKPAEPAASTVTEAPKEEPKPTEAPKEEPKPTEEPAPEPTEEPAPVEEPAAEGIHQISILNTLVMDMEAVKSEETRFNSYQLPSYNIGEIAEKNFWFIPEDPAQEIITVVAYTDGYKDDGTDSYESLCVKGLSFGFEDPNAGGGTMEVFTGPTQNKNYMVWFMGYFTTSKVCALFMPADGWQDLPKLFKEIGMASAEAYDFICADGYKETIYADDLEKVKIYYSDQGTIDASSIAYAGYGLTDIRYIVPEGMEKGSEPVEGINQIVVMPNADGILGVEPTEILPYGGNIYPGYPVAAVLEKAGITSTTCKAVSYKDGSTYDYDMENLMKVYFCVDHSKGNDAYTLGKDQPYGAVLKAAGQYIFDDAAIVYVPPVDVMPDGYSAVELFKAVGMVEAEEYDFVCADGYTETIHKDDLEKVKIFINGEGVDATSILYPEYTLMNILTIVPAK